ncbi:uncharacterized protein A4U43_C03F10710 [Asparagus officinalis]|uniref:DCD domain-containing protein n=1 Tax=Asparagus officinalis TaxID=4686 RepID=A0A5P1F9R8_ASPOF|nr:uncharacterized protein A4U43_C03F10710 [Asparagus officinalis]
MSGKLMVDVGDWNGTVVMRYEFTNGSQKYATMNVEEVEKFQIHESTFAGAILMSNRETKLECLQRKLFGLPSSKSKFIKQIKTGMLLFLFEHEERKLYGVFEATSDGALNIEPNAFLSSGKFFPAQVLFKRVWMCKPLSEDEFYDAIKDNYYTQNKFHFGLSHDQVCLLLFYSSFAAPSAYVLLNRK